VSKHIGRVFQISSLQISPFCLVLAGAAVVGPAVMGYRAGIACSAASFLTSFLPAEAVEMDGGSTSAPIGSFYSCFRICSPVFAVNLVCGRQAVRS